MELIRVLHLDSGREMRGGQWQVLLLHRNLTAAGHQSMLMAREGSLLMQAAIREGLPCERLRVGFGGYDIVHAHDARAHTQAALFARAPLIVSRRVAFPVKTGILSHWKYSRPRLFLAISRFVASQLLMAGVEAARIAVVYDGVSVPAERDSGETILIPETTDPAKGMGLAEEAARIAGVAVRRSRDLAADLPHAKALIYITHSEGLGSGILLAMAHGVPAVASKVGGVPEIIREGVDGLLTPNEADSIAAAIVRIAGVENAAMGCAAREAVIERFSTERMVTGTLAAYRRVLGHG